MFVRDTYLPGLDKLRLCADIGEARSVAGPSALQKCLPSAKERKAIFAEVERDWGPMRRLGACFQSTASPGAPLALLHMNIESTLRETPVHESNCELSAPAICASIYGLGHVF